MVDVADFKGSTLRHPALHRYVQDFLAFSPIFEPFLTPFLISNSSNTHPKHHHISSVPASRCVELGLALNLGRSSLSSTLRRAPCAVLPQ